MAAVQSRWSYRALEEAPVLHSVASPKFVMPPAPRPDPNAALITANRAKLEALKTLPYYMRPPSDRIVQCGLTTVPQYVLALTGLVLGVVGFGSARYAPGTYSLPLIGAGFVLFLAAHLERPTRLLVLSLFRPKVVLDCPLAGSVCGQNCLSQRRVSRPPRRLRATGPRAPLARRRSGPVVAAVHAGACDRWRPQPSARAVRTPAR